MLAAAPAARAQNTRTWTGATDSNWAVPTNWNAALIPGSGDTALFNGAGNGHTTISLGGATLPIRNISFDNASAAAYTLGIIPSSDKFNFDAGGAIAVSSSVVQNQRINAAIQTNGSLMISNSALLPTGLTLNGDLKIGNSGTLTVNLPGTSGSITLNGIISDVAGQPGSMSLLATASGSANANVFIINGANTFTGPTTISVNTGTSGRIELGSNTPFGTGTVTINLVSGGVAPQINGENGTRTLTNPMKLNSGMTLIGDNSLNFNGPITIINSAIGGTRTINNNITSIAAGGGVSFGLSPGSSTITLGNPVSNGGDGVGKTLIFSPAAGANTFINSTMQDPAPGGGAASGSVQFAGSVGGVTRINGLNTYTGPTVLNGSSTVQFSQSYNAGGTSGPFGIGTITPNSASNNILQPIGGSRTLANPITMNFGMTAANAASDTSSLTLSGPITMTANGRFITNNFAPAGGTLTLGSAAAPSTITLPTSGGQVLRLAGTGATVINDVIQNPASVPSPAPGIEVLATGPVRFNGLSTYTGNTTFSGASTPIRIGVNSNGLPGPTFTAGPFGTGTLNMNSTSPPLLQPFGADRTVANPINMALGFFASNPSAAEDPTGNHNLTLTGPITLGVNGRNITNNLKAGVSLTLGSAASPSTITLGNTLTFQTQTAGGGLTFVNHSITGAGGITVQNDAVVHLNGANDYAGATSVTGTGSPKLFVNGTKTGAGAVTIAAVGTLGGTGTVAGTITNNGTIAPGTSVGTLTAAGNVTMGANSHLAIELSGAAADKLVVGGNLSLSNVDFLDVTGTGSGLSWIIATYGSLTGTFNNVTPGYTVNYGTGANSQITLNKAPTGINGDFDNNGKVDAGDYVTWRRSNGTNNPLLNDNGLGTPVGPAHYTLWRANFAKPPGSGTGTFDDSPAVPEPSTMVLFLAGLTCATFGVRA
jgi:hypothetical protein